MKIAALKAYEILDSRGNPTVACETYLENGRKAWAAVPSGASTGKNEAVELRDGDPARVYGKGVTKAVSNINSKIAPLIKGFAAEDQEVIDRAMIELDGTPDKSNLGANAILAVSLSVARAAAISLNLELFEYLTKFNPSFTGKYRLPLIQANILNGGKHAFDSTDIQEFMIIPVTGKSVARSVIMAAQIYQSLKKILITHNFSVNVGDEGGFVPSLLSNLQPFDLICEAIGAAGFKAGKDVVLGIDAAATSFYHDGKYMLKKENRQLSADEISIYYQDMMSKYPVWNLEDIFYEEDFDSFSRFNGKFNGKYQIVGDDLYCTNAGLLDKGIENKSANAIIIKPNQIGTLTETVKTIHLALKNNIQAIISHRSGETEDTFIADLAVAMGTGQFKSGATARGERTAKYNRLIQIEQMIGDKAEYPFPDSLKNFISGQDDII